MDYEGWQTDRLLNMYNTIKDSLPYDNQSAPGRYAAREYKDLLDQVAIIEQILDRRGVAYIRISRR